MNKTPLLLFIFVILFPLGLFAQNTLTIKITGIKKAKGDIRVQLIQGEANYKAQPSIALDSTYKKATKPSVSLQLFNIPNGEYVLKVFQDYDYDQVLKTNMFGIPKEPYGFSNSARGSMGPPSYEQVKFTIDGNTTQTILIK